MFVIILLKKDFWKLNPFVIPPTCFCDSKTVKYDIRKTG